MFKKLFDYRSLPVRMIMGYVLVVVLTTVTIGLPAMLLMRQQLDHQSWALVEHGQIAAEAFCAAQQREIIGFATLTAERPTLAQLLNRGDKNKLFNYLDTLQRAVGYDLIVVCDPQDRVLASTDATIQDRICAEQHTGGIYVIEGKETPQVLMTAIHPLTHQGKVGGRVIVGTHMDHSFATRMRSYSGLENTLVVNGQLVASSFDDPLPSLAAVIRQPDASTSPGGVKRGRFALGDQPYYSGILPLKCLGVEVEVALQVADSVLAQRRLVWLMTGGMLVVAALGMILGVYVSRQISQPLVNLAEAASEFSQGDLSSPVVAEAHVREQTQVAQALENARVNLLKTLTDLRREKAWTSHLLESIVEGIMTLDDERRITFFSHGAERITGWRREQVLNRSCDEYFKPVEIEAPFSQVIPLPGLRKKIAVKLANERVATLAITGARLALPDAGDAHIAVVFRDITEEDIVHHLLGQFLANVVHEFRTPLSALNASIELLVDQDAQSNPNERQALLKGLQVSVINLQTLVDNLLESASFEAGHFRVSPRPYELSDLISEAERVMNPLLEKYGQRLVIRLPHTIPLVQADPRRTVQVLVNLLSNASKYGPADAEILLSAIIEGGWVRVKVADRGPGIPVKQRSSLFRRFTYHDAIQAQIKVGAGLGLSVVKAVVEAHGGNTGVDTPPGGGTIFWFTIPIANEK
jgi:two-component system phosphate regulon sensor histidine kinase PhoR